MQHISILRRRGVYIQAGSGSADQPASTRDFREGEKKKAVGRDKNNVIICLYMCYSIGYSSRETSGAHVTPPPPHPSLRLRHRKQRRVRSEQVVLPLVVNNDSDNLIVTTKTNTFQTHNIIYLTALDTLQILIHVK